MRKRKTRYEWNNAFNPFLTNTGSLECATGSASAFHHLDVYFVDSSAVLLARSASEGFHKLNPRLRFGLVFVPR